MKKKLECCLLAAVSCIAVVSAQSTNGTTSPQLASLRQLTGYWETQAASMQMDGKEYKFPYYADFKGTADNSGLLMTEWATIPGMGKLAGTNLMGVSPVDGKIHWFSVDNMGVAHEHIGEFTDSKHFSMVHKEMQNEKEYVENVMIGLPASGVLELKVEAMLDGKQVQLITGTFHRKKMN